MAGYKYKGSEFDVQKPLAPPMPRKPKAKVAVCGTLGGASRHRVRVEPLCTPCMEVVREYKKAWRARVKVNKPPVEPKPKKPTAPKPERRKTGECGTLSGYRRHRTLGEPKCRPCKDAYNARSREEYADRTAGPTGFTGEKCGTNSGNTSHVYYKVPVCAPCRKAKSEYDAARRLARKAAS